MSGPLIAAWTTVLGVSDWVVLLGALLVLAFAKFAAYRLFTAAWTMERLAGRRADVLLTIIAGSIPLVAGLWLLVSSPSKVAGIVVLGVWLLIYLPLATVLIRYAERHGVREPLQRTRRRSFRRCE